MAAAHAYRPRLTQSDAAVRIVSEHLEAFAQRAERADAPIAGFALDELRSMVRCGDFEHGFLRFHCCRCGEEVRVPFSCKARGTCPSCMGRRMCETASLWVKHQLPAVGYRQWVVSFDGPMAVRLGYNRDLLNAVCRVLSARLTQWLRRAAKRAHRRVTVSGLHAGVITVIQRFRSDLGLYVHLHCLVTDGVFETPAGTDRAPVFLSVPEPEPQDLIGILRGVANDPRLVHDSGTDDDDDVDAGIAACVQLGLQRCGPQVVRVQAPAKLNVHAFGMNLHAATTVDGRDRKRLERLCRYLLRPPFSAGSIEWLPDGRVRLDIARRARSVTMTPEQFIAKLIALVPPPGCTSFATEACFPMHTLRRVIAPEPSTPVVREPTQTNLWTPAGTPALGQELAVPRPSRIAWAQLLARVFAWTHSNARGPVARGDFERRRPCCRVRRSPRCCTAPAVRLAHRFLVKSASSTDGSREGGDGQRRG